ncbi:hypothetical protein Tco_0036682, partial [Tanacetum coccineum]
SNEEPNILNNDEVTGAGSSRHDVLNVPNNDDGEGIFVEGGGPNNVTVKGILRTGVTGTSEVTATTTTTSTAFGIPTVDNVIAIFGVSIMSIKDLDDLTRRIEAGDCDVLDGLNKDERKAAMDAIMALLEKFLATRNNNTPGVENETVNLNVENGPHDTTTVDNLVSTSNSPIVQSVFIKPKPVSYARVVGASSSVNTKGKSNFRQLESKNVCDGMELSIPLKVVETVFSKDGRSLIATKISKPVMLDSYTSSTRIDS